MISGVVFEISVRPVRGVHSMRRQCEAAGVYMCVCVGVFPERTVVDRDCGWPACSKGHLFLSCSDKCLSVAWIDGVGSTVTRVVEFVVQDMSGIEPEGYVMSYGS